MLTDDKLGLICWDNQQEFRDSAFQETQAALRSRSLPLSPLIVCILGLWAWSEERDVSWLSGTFGHQRSAGEQVQPATHSDQICHEYVASLHIVTPVGSATHEDLVELATSIRWGCVHRWTVVYDTNQQHNLEAGFTDMPKIKEIFFQAEGVKGNSQRNRALDEIKHGLVYFLDDDNVIHPNFWRILPNITLGHITTFDQARTAHDGGILTGDSVTVNAIDTAMFVIDRALIGSTRFLPFEYSADGIFAQEVLNQHPDSHLYIPEVAAFYNYKAQFFTVSY